MKNLAFNGTYGMDSSYFIGSYSFSLIQHKILNRSTDFIVRLCVYKRINTKPLKSDSLSKYRLNMVDELLKVLTENDLKEYLNFN